MMKPFFSFILALMVSAGAIAIEFQGTLAQGGMVWGQVSPNVQLRLDDAPVKVGAEGHFVFGFGRDAAPTARLVILHQDGKKEEMQLAIADRDFNIERIDGLPPKTVTMPPDWVEQRKIETGKVREARSHLANNLHWFRGFIKPAEGRYSGFYGSQRILNGQPRSPHYGIDIAGPTGTPVVSPAGGIVRLAVPDFLLEGGIVIIDHGFGVTSTLFHMHSVDVEEGEWVHQGDPIGTIGATGRATGPHVDWRVNWRSVRLDPMLLISDSVTEEIP